MKVLLKRFLFIPGALGFRALEIEASSEAVQEGDDLSIRCSFTNYTNDDFVRWKKLLHSGGDVELATNKLLTKPLLQETGRYSMRSATREVGGSPVKDYIMDIRSTITLSFR
jgi:hypothetical protein